MNRPTSPELIEDVQNIADKRHLDIDQVGIKAIKHPIVVKDKSSGSQHTIANFDMYVQLPHNFKGTHMSRFVEILNENDKEISVESFESILRAMLDRLESKSCNLFMNFPYFINKSAPIIWATLAANLSLSPYLISEVAVVSFSLTIGTAPSLKRFSNVLLTFKARLLCSVSSGVIKICPILNLYLSNNF